MVTKSKKKKGKKKKQCDIDDVSSDDSCPVPKFGGLNMLCSYPDSNKCSKNSTETSHVSSDYSKSPVSSVQVMQIGCNPSKSYANEDSDSSAGTDEIILRIKSQHSHKENTSKTRSNLSLPTSATKTSNPSTLDQNLLLSELYSSAPDISETTASTHDPPKNSPSDSYDSDLDSNDFELVAKKLAQRAAGNTTKTFLKGTNSNDSSLKALPLTPNVLSAKPEKKKLQSNLDVCSPQEVQIKQPQKQLTGDERRLQAVKQRMKQKQQQAQIVQAALHNVDTQDNKKRKVFSSDEEEEKDESKCMTDSGKTETVKKKIDETKQLFDSESDSDDEEDIDMFRSRPHLEGKKGEKLMKLERRYGDPRFKLDAKFADSDSEEELAVSEKGSGEKEVVDELAAERDANLKVLEKVVGKATLDQFSQKIKRNTKQMIDMNTVRFDPTKLVLSDQAQDEKSKKTTKVEIKDQRDERVSDKKEKKKKSSDIPIANDKSAATAEEDMTTETKEGETKTSKAMDKQSNADKPAKSQVTVASSLIDLFKEKNEDISEEEPAGFSLLDQFDKSENGLNSKPNMKDQGKSASPLSALFKSSSDGPDSKSSQGLGIVNSANESDESSSQDEDSDEEEHKDEDVDSEDSASSKEDETIQKDTSSLLSSSNDESSDEEDENDDDNNVVEESGNKTEGKKFTSVSDLLGNESGSEQNDSEDELERDIELEDNVSDNEAKLNKADPLDIRYTKEKWAERWKEIRPVIVKIYKRKHKDAVKNKRTQTEMKRRKEFSKNSKRFAWFKHRK